MADSSFCSSQQRRIILSLLAEGREYATLIFYGFELSVLGNQFKLSGKFYSRQFLELCQ